jgi:hypothetical protein
MRKFLATLAVLAVTGIVPATAGAHATQLVPKQTVNGCTVLSSSLSLNPHPSLNKKPGVQFSINCITITSWSARVQCQVDKSFDHTGAWQQCSNTSIVEFQAFNAGGTWDILVGNGSWGCNNNYDYRPRFSLGADGWITSWPEVPQPGWNCSG